MKRFDWQLLKWKIKDYFWWLRIYKTRLLLAFVVFTFITHTLFMAGRAAVNYYTPTWARSHNKVEDVLTTQEKLKLQRCSEFVYVLMRENVQLRARCE